MWLCRLLSCCWIWVSLFCCFKITGTNLLIKQEVTKEKFTYLILCFGWDFFPRKWEAVIGALVSWVGCCCMCWTCFFLYMICQKVFDNVMYRKTFFIWIYNCETFNNAFFESVHLLWQNMQKVACQAINELREQLCLTLVSLRL